MTVTTRPDGRFEQLWLPLWPLASNDLREGIYRTSRTKAIGKRYIEANPDAVSNLLVVDIDHPDALLRPLWDRQGWMPNVVVENPSNGHAHAVWALSAFTAIWLTTSSFTGRAKLRKDLRLFMSGPRGYVALELAVE